MWQAGYAQSLPVDSGSSLPVLYNEGRAPASAVIPSGYRDAGSRWWLDMTGDPYLENRYRMFSPNPAVVTTSSGDIAFDIRPGAAWDAIALFNIGADVLEVELIDGPEPYGAALALRYDEILSPQFPNQSVAALIDIPEINPVAHPAALLRVRLRATVPRIIHLGCFVIGKRTRIGYTLYGLETEFMDFSLYRRDTWGNVTARQRGYSDRITFPHVIRAEAVEQARAALIARRSVETVYIGAADVPLSIIYGFFRDLVVPIEGVSDPRASVVVESVLQGVPASSEALPTRTVFIETDGAACITSDMGSAAELCLVDGLPDGYVKASVLDRDLEPGESIAWEIEWLSGASDNAFSVSTLTTDCDQALSILTWPSGAPLAQSPAVAAIRATITLADESVIATEPAILTLAACAAPCPECPPAGCEKTATAVRWWGDSTGAYSATSVTGKMRQTTTFINANDGHETYRTYIDCVESSARHFLIDARDRPAGGPGRLEAAQVDISLSLTDGSAWIMAGMEADGLPTESAGSSVTLWTPNAVVLVIVESDGCFSGTLDVVVTWELLSGSAAPDPAWPINEITAGVPVAPFLWAAQADGNLCSSSLRFEWDYVSATGLALSPAVKAVGNALMVAAPAAGCDGTGGYVTAGKLTVLPFMIDRETLHNATGSFASDTESLWYPGCYSVTASVTLEVETEIEITLSSDDIDIRLILAEAQTPVGYPIAMDGGGVAAGVTTTLPPGDYVVEASAYDSDASGEFRLSVVAVSESPLDPVTLTIAPCAGGLRVYGTTLSWDFVNISLHQGGGEDDNPLSIDSSNMPVYAAYGMLYFCAERADGSWVSRSDAAVTWTISGAYEWASVTTSPFLPSWMAGDVVAVFGVSPLDYYSSEPGTVTVEVTDTANGHVFPPFELRIIGGP